MAGKRQMCDRCNRAVKGGCICSALPLEPVVLHECHCFILQHPHEHERKNRSLPFVELCLSTESVTVVVGRHFGRVESRFVERLHDPIATVWLIYPSDEAIPLAQALSEWRNEQERTYDSSGLHNRPSLTLLLLDGTWKYAKEMDTANRARNLYPAHLKHVKLTPDDLRDLPLRNRFDIRTPPSENHLSTAETLAWVAAQVENDTSVYDTIMKPLDRMVEQWHSFQEQSKPTTKTDD